MGYDMYWGLRRAQVLNPDETARLTAHITEWAETIIGYGMSVTTSARADRWIVVGALRPEADEELGDEEAPGGYSSEVQERVFDAMAALRDLFQGSELTFGDDFYEYVWVDSGFEPREHRAGSSPPSDGDWTPIEAEN